MIGSIAGAPLPCRKKAPVPSLGIILSLTLAAAQPSPSPSPASAASAPADPCGDVHTNVLAAIDRPSIGFSSCAVKPGDRLFEIGYAVQASSTTHLATYPQNFARVGAWKNVELDWIGPIFGIQRSGSQTINGVFDSGFGAKFEYWHDSQNAAAVDLLYTAPTGSSAFSAHGPIETLNLDGTYSFSPAFSVGATLGMQSDSAQDRAGRFGRFGSLLPSVVLTDQISERTQFYGEAFAQTPIRPDGGTLFGLDGGVQYMIAPWLECDVEAARTITDLDRAHYYGFGFGIRF